MRIIANFIEGKLQKKEEVVFLIKADLSITI